MLKAQLIASVVDAHLQAAGEAVDRLFDEAPTSHLFLAKARINDARELIARAVQKETA